MKPNNAIGLGIGWCVVPSLMLLGYAFGALDMPLFGVVVQSTLVVVGAGMLCYGTIRKSMEQGRNE